MIKYSLIAEVLMKVKIAVVGATGVVGRMMLRVLEERNFPVSELVLFASKRSAGAVMEFRGEKNTVRELNAENIKAANVKYALFSAGSDVSREFAPVFAKYGAVAIDNSKYWRMDKNVPLVVPEVNPDDAFKHHGIIANPNCSTIQAVVALKPLHDAFKIKRIVYSTYQAVSGAGRMGIEDLENGVKGKAPQKFPYPIAYNIIPHIDTFDDDGYTFEEMKMVNETRKILGDDTLKITATTARVPVFYGHSESINVEFFKPVTRESALEVLSAAKGVVLRDEPQNNIYPMPIEAAGSDEVYVGRVRQDFSVDSGLNLWVVADNIRKGAASNTVQIAELLNSRD